MKTNELIKKVKELGFDVEIHKRCIKITRKNLIIAVTNTDRRYALDVFNPFNEEWENGDELLDLLVEYAKTPLDEREEEKRKRRSFIWNIGGYLIKTFICTYEKRLMMIRKWDLEL